MVVLKNTKFIKMVKNLKINFEAKKLQFFQFSNNTQH